VLNTLFCCNQHPVLIAVSVAKHPVLTAVSVAKHPILTAVSVAKHPVLTAVSVAKHPVLTAVSVAININKIQNFICEFIPNGAVHPWDILYVEHQNG
jgi:hypothetical protein